MFGLLLSIMQRIEKGDTRLLPNEVLRLKESTENDMADVVSRLCIQDCVEIQDDTDCDLDLMLTKVAQSAYMNEKMYYTVKVLGKVHPILDTELWNKFISILGK